MTQEQEKLYEKLISHNHAYYGYELSKGETKTILQSFEEIKTLQTEKKELYSQ